MAKSGFFEGKIKIKGKNISWESTFPIGTKYSCKRCGLCCNLVSLTPKDVQSFKKCGVEESIAYPSKDNPMKMPSLKMRDDSNCIQLNKDNLCQIYKNRPMMCRSYPFVLTPGPDGKIYVDISLRCPYINESTLPKIKEGEVATAVKLNVGHVPDMILRAMTYRKSLADHVRVGYGPALVTRKRRISFMQRAMWPLENLKDPVDLPEIMSVWSDVIGLIGHRVIVQRDNGALKGKSQDEDIIRNLPDIDEEGTYKLDTNRWKFMFEDIGNYVFWRDEAEEVNWAKIDVANTIKIDDSIKKWGELTKLKYSKEALDEVISYMKFNLRRPSFELTVAKVTEYLIDYKNIPALDYEISAMIFSNAVIVHLDPIARVLAKIRNHDKIEKDDVRMAISNLDSELLSALTDGTLAKVILDRLDISNA